MKSKKWLFGGIAIVALSAVITWACWPEYGKGYSEEQRRNWNETVSSEKVVSGLFVVPMYNRREQGGAPEWKVDFSKPAVTLPLEVMTAPRLGLLADQGNGDACLELAFRSFSSRDSFDVYWMGKNLRRAVKVGRAGSDYLLRLVERRKAMGKDVQGSDVAGYADFVSSCSTMLNEECITEGR